MSDRTLYRRILGPLRVSHHPLCMNFEDHIYHIRGKRICRGCVMQYSGMVISLVIITIGALFSIWSELNEIQIGIVLYLLIIPTILTAFLLKNRVLKDIARFMLGISFTVAFLLLIFTPDFLIKGWIVINFIPGYMYLNMRRGEKNSEICENCEEYNNLPNCRGYQTYVDRERIFVAQAIQGGIKDPFALPPDQLEE